VAKKYLFVHQNFPGQFVHVAAALAAAGHQVVALGITGRNVPGVHYVRYEPARPPAGGVVRGDLAAKLVRAEGCASAMLALQAQGFEPDVIVAHPGWGEALYCKDVWPRARLVVFAEFYYTVDGSDYAFDPEFQTDTAAARMRLRLKNTALLHALAAADAAYAPTHWQKSQVPPEYRHKVEVIFDGIDTQAVQPAAGVSVHLKRDNLALTRADEVITFVNRNLEPYRGFHTFMRALPDMLARRPHAHVLIVGRDGVSYGARPSGGGTWKDAMLREVGSHLPVNRVHFLGPLPYAQYLQVLQVSTCHVYLTYPFVLSWSCLESMSAGNVVVASDTAPVREVIDDGRNGLLTGFFDTKALAARVADVLAAPGDYAALSAQARKTVQDCYDLRHVCLPQLLQFIA
jgi:glycosyltransferase involved in cell wall biosynthesis